MEMFLGILLVSVGGLVMGGLGWPMKLMQKFQFEHWWFIGMLFGLFIVPWLITLTMCPNAFEAYGNVETSVLLKSNLFSLCWGIANVILGICFVRIGIALSFAILTGVGVSLGVTIPMVVKPTGLFSGSADLTSPAGKMILIGVAVMIVGIILVAFAGFGRERMLKNRDDKSGSFLGGLIMCVIAGILSCGISFAFIYSQGPIVEAMKAQGASDMPANIAVWAVGLLAGGLVNIIYPAYLLTKNKSWSVFRQSGKEIALSLIIGVNFIAAVTLMGKGMLLFGALGASIGFGVYQAMQILGSQAVGFISGEWKGVHGKPLTQMYVGILILILAALVMAYGNSLPKA
jgi:hypothetical protein